MSSPAYCEYLEPTSQPADQNLGSVQASRWIGNPESTVELHYMEPLKSERRLAVVRTLAVVNFSGERKFLSGDLNPDSVIEASFKVLSAVSDIMKKVQLFQERILTDAEQLALAAGAAAKS